MQLSSDISRPEFEGEMPANNSYTTFMNIPHCEPVHR